MKRSEKLFRFPGREIVAFAVGFGVAIAISAGAQAQPSNPQPNNPKPPMSVTQQPPKPMTPAQPPKPVTPSTKSKPATPTITKPQSNSSTTGKPGSGATTSKNDGKTVTVITPKDKTKKTDGESAAKDKPKSTTGGESASGNGKTTTAKPPVILPTDEKKTARGAGMPSAPPTTALRPSIGIVGNMPQIDKWREHQWFHSWRPHHHWRHDWDFAHRFWGPDFGTGNTFSFSNTYSIENSGNTTQNFDYSKPLPSPSPEDRLAASPPESPKKKDGNKDAASSDDTAAQVNKQFDVAREWFKDGDYDKALEQVNAAIEKRPSDATLHEFKALCLFAQEKYKEAAPVLYAVIAAGPGWDWDTMKTLYQDGDTYKKQLSALKAFVAKEPNSGYGHFVLAYHYLVLGSKDAAVKELNEVVRSQPEDKLSAALLKFLTQPA